MWFCGLAVGNLLQMTGSALRTNGGEVRMLSGAKLSSTPRGVSGHGEGGSNLARVPWRYLKRSGTTVYRCAPLGIDVQPVFLLGHSG